MNVLFTIAIIVGLAAWASAIYARLTRLRNQVKQAWTRLESDTANAVVRNVYNRHVDLYNGALDSFPANLIAPAAGFTPARRFEA